MSCTAGKCPNEATHIMVRSEGGFIPERPIDGEKPTYCFVHVVKQCNVARKESYVEPV